MNQDLLTAHTLRTMPEFLHWIADLIAQCSGSGSFDHLMAQMQSAYVSGDGSRCLPQMLSGNLPRWNTAARGVFLSPARRVSTKFILDATRHAACRAMHPTFLDACGGPEPWSTTAGRGR